MQAKVDPVKGFRQVPGTQHAQLLNHVGRLVRGKPKGKAEQGHQTPRDAVCNILHEPKIPQRIRLIQFRTMRA